MSNYKKHNENYRYILFMVDIKSRLSLMEKLKSKTAEEVYRAFLKIHYYCETIGNRIYALYSDKGSEWTKIEKNKEKYNYKMFFKEVDTHRGTGIVDRKIRFWRGLIEKYFTQNNTLNWNDVYQQINNNMNNTENKTTKQKPIDIWDKKKNKNKLLKLINKLIHLK